MHATTLNKVNNVLTCVRYNKKNVTHNSIIFEFMSHAACYKVLYRLLDSRNFLSRPFHLALAFIIVLYGDHSQPQ